ncbi:class I SAM-dependent methyltransferase, partial [Roseobacter sp.]|uniref:class I SAM-dependent methyltransferase n=1 Tax=Roseobacter sp. TaxID=1907202 RepID=UPI0025E7A1A8
ANHVGETLKLDYWRRWNKGGARDKTILRHKKAVRARLRELRKDPELAFLERAAIALSTQRLAELKTDPDFAKLRQDIVGPESENLSVVRRANAGMKLRSPSRHKNRRAFLRRMPKGGRCAEIGVWQGSFSLEILDVTQPAELILIDPWGLLAGREESEWTHAKHKDSAVMDRMYRDVLDEFEGNDRVSVRKGFSADLLAEYADGYFDWVYIDGNHLYDFVRKDIELSALKVRQGGIIAGDDYRWSKDGRLHVQDAVQDAMAALKLGPEALSVKGQQFMIRL